MLWAALLLAVVVSPRNKDLVWTILEPAKDSRTPDMVDFDRKMDEHLVDMLDVAKELKERLRLASGRLEDLHRSRSAFASLHFDPVRRGEITEAEKKAIEHYLARGGFLLLVEDNYPYSQDEFRRSTHAAAFDFLKTELPARNRDFRAERAGESHPVFHQLYQIQIPDAILRETFENPSYRGETVFLHRDRLVGYTFSLYAYDDGEKWVPLGKPYRPYHLLESAYQLMVNIYLHSLLR